MCMAGWLDGLGGWYCLGVGVVFGGGGWSQSRARQRYYVSCDSTVIGHHTSIHTVDVAIYILFAYKYVFFIAMTMSTDGT